MTDCRLDEVQLRAVEEALEYYLDVFGTIYLLVPHTIALTKIKKELEKYKLNSYDKNKVCLRNKSKKKIIYD